MRPYLLASLLPLALVSCETTQPASAPSSPTSWATLRAPVAYDGDTLYITVTTMPPELAEMSIRVRGIDTPEMRGDCPAEKTKAIEARDYARSLVTNAHAVTFENLEHDKYGGRVLADVYVDGQGLDDLLITRGLARPYDGGQRLSWCQTEPTP